MQSSKLWGLSYGYDRSKSGVVGRYRCDTHAFKYIVGTFRGLSYGHDRSKSCAVGRYRCDIDAWK